MSYEILENLTLVNYNARGTAPTWIVIHNTANATSAAGTAYNNTEYFKRVYRDASAHYFVDDGDVVWRCVRDTDSAWHVGDAASRNGASNANAIGIEVCERADGSFSQHEVDVLRWLVPMLMQKYGIPASRVCRHRDVTGKVCPRGYVDDGKWAALKAAILEGGDDMSTYAEEAYRELVNDADPTGRGKRGTMRVRIAYMAQKQERMQESINALEKKLDRVLAALEK